MIDPLLDDLRHEPHTIVGLDFASSLCSWFLAKSAMSRAHDRCSRGAMLMPSCAHKSRHSGVGSFVSPQLIEHFRMAEQQARSVSGIWPNSIFQVYMPGMVGTGSLWSMPTLHRVSLTGWFI
ncbi:MAG: hypothetical protein AB7O38_12390 [Pirellulaceae bacterium]